MGNATRPQRITWGSCLRETLKLLQEKAGLAASELMGTYLAFLFLPRWTMRESAPLTAEDAGRAAAYWLGVQILIFPFLLTRTAIRLGQQAESRIPEGNRWDARHAWTGFLEMLEDAIVQGKHLHSVITGPKDRQDAIRDAAAMAFGWSDDLRDLFAAALAVATEARHLPGVRFPNKPDNAGAWNGAVMNLSSSIRVTEEIRKKMIENPDLGMAWMRPGFTPCKWEKFPFQKSADEGK